MYFHALKLATILRWHDLQVQEHSPRFAAATRSKDSTLYFEAQGPLL